MAEVAPPFSGRPRRAALLGLLSAGLGVRAAPREVALAPADVLGDYRRFLAGRDVLALTQFGGAYSRRDVVEVALLQQALGRVLDLTAIPTTQRLTLELREGHGLCSATSYWRQDFDADAGLLFSDPLIGDGEFVVGLYTTPDNQRALAARSLEDVRQLRVLSSRHWRVDWASLERLGIRELLHVGSWDAMPRMVAGGRADVLLAPFPARADLALSIEGQRFVPVPGLKLAMSGTRHFVVAASLAPAAGFLGELNRGLAGLRERGRLRQAYEQSGFFSRQVERWRRL